MKITGVLHIGAHDCEEQGVYMQQNIPTDNIFWVEAMPEKVTHIRSVNPNIHIYQALISDTDNEIKKFYITNNGQSSSMLELGTHQTHYPHIHVVNTILLSTKRMDTLIEEKSIPIDRVNFINLDIQGSELTALKSMEKYLNGIQYIYTEVNTEKVYKDCCLVKELDQYLAKFGFMRVVTKTVKEGWGDALYVKL